MCGNIIDILANQPHIVAECICVKCLARFIDVRPEGVLLKDMECPECGNVGCVIQTGQPLEDVK
jgi:hypothetical protein